MTEVTWSAQPYRWLTELRDNYTKATIIANRKDAPEFIEQIYNWMWDNAPWQDRTEAAIRGLRVRLKGEDSKTVSNFKQDTTFRQLQKQDRAKLKTTNAARVAAGKVPLSKLPVSQQTAAQYLKQWRKELTPILEIEISHNRDLTYAKWLEIANGGKYSIIRPTMDLWGHKLFERVRRNGRLLNSRVTLGEVVEFDPSEEFAKYVSQKTKERRAEGKKSDYEPWDPKRHPKEREVRRNRDYNEWDAARYYQEKKKQLRGLTSIEQERLLDALERRAQGVGKSVRDKKSKGYR